MGSETTLTRAYEAASRGKAWTIPFDTLDPAGADDIFIYLRNRGTPSLVAYRLDVTTTVTGTLEFVRTTGKAAGTFILDDAPINLGGQGFKPEADIKTSLDVTGLTISERINHIEVLQAIETRTFFFEEGLWVPTGQNLGLNWEAATGILSGALYFYEEGNGR
jgi:hypothetical protein